MVGDEFSDGPFSHLELVTGREPAVQKSRNVASELVSFLRVTRAIDSLFVEYHKVHHSADAKWRRRML